VPVASLRRKSGRLSFDEAACVGVNYLAAWRGVEAVGLKAGKTILLIGAGGGVGSAVAPIARRLGARVIGADTRPPRPDAPSRKRCSSAPSICRRRFARRLARADVVFDLVGGVMFRSALNCLALRGRLVEIAATGQPEVSFDLVDFYRNESRHFGVGTLKRDLTASAAALDALQTFSPETTLPRRSPRPAGLPRRRRPIAKWRPASRGRVALRLSARRRRSDRGPQVRTSASAAGKVLSRFKRAGSMRANAPPDQSSSLSVRTRATASGDCYVMAEAAGIRAE
jgi:hypothetical protein